MYFLFVLALFLIFNNSSAIPINSSENIPKSQRKEQVVKIANDFKMEILKDVIKNGVMTSKDVDVIIELDKISKQDSPDENKICYSDFFDMISNIQTKLNKKLTIPDKLYDAIKSVYIEKSVARSLLKSFDVTITDNVVD
ncbi:uncharacterized protein LOC126898989 [Daktulosphaira vitifoliae]|uniref:uncharacterized protein LOC126898989 n=1 Tax=Daktulosphaira vitifoliae TaxID=58002 RepID=UPI0021AA4BBD|nr:uncharacterized protein LOC126898989 [Daktulosphaira vitifoliae]